MKEYGDVNIKVNPFRCADEHSFSVSFSNQAKEGKREKIPQCFYGSTAPYVEAEEVCLENRHSSYQLL